MRAFQNTPRPAAATTLFVAAAVVLILGTMVAPSRATAPNPVLVLGSGSIEEGGMCAVLKVPAGLPNAGYHGIKCWGYNEYDQFARDYYYEDETIGEGASGDYNKLLGNSLPFSNWPTQQTYTYVGLGYEFGCVLTGKGAVWCAGYGYEGQLGDGAEDEEDHGQPVQVEFYNANGGPSPTIKSLSVGYGASCAASSLGTVHCWGEEEDDDVSGINSDNVGSYASQREIPIVNFGTGLIATQVSKGYEHSCAVFSNGKAKCFGSNEYGQCGQNGSLATSSSIYEHAHMGNNLPFILLDNAGAFKVNLLVAGPYHTCASVGTTKQLKCFGYNDYFQCGVLNGTTNVGSTPGQMGNALPFVNIGSGLQVAGLALTWYSTCALFTSGQVKCWGYNTDGELGQGNYDGYTGMASGKFVMGNALPFVNLGSGVKAKQISAADYSFCILSTTGGVKCWGDNTDGSLGYPDDNNRGGKNGTMGNALPFVSLGTASGKGRRALALKHMKQRRLGQRSSARSLKTLRGSAAEAVDAAGGRP